MFRTTFLPFLLVLVFIAVVGCDDDDDTTLAPTATREFTLTIENVSPALGVQAAGAFDTPVGSGMPAPIGPGGAYEFSFDATPGARLSLASMFVQSNDAFYATDEAGIALFDGSGNAITGDVTGELALWDAGTEANEQPGVGLNQAPRQASAGAGDPDTDTSVRRLADGFTYPDVDAAVRLTLSQTSVSAFTARLENIAVAYDFPASGVFDTPAGASSPAPIGPGDVYDVVFDAAPGTRLSFATMFIPSNDYFYAPDPVGIALYDASGVPLSGDVTGEVSLWDAGSEIDQEPGLGADQPQRSPGTGAVDPDGTVRPAGNPFGNVPVAGDVVQVTRTSLGGTTFRLRIENVSTTGTLATSDAATQAVPLSPGVWVVHAEPAPLFEMGASDRGEGLVDIAEDGNPAGLGSALSARTGLGVVVSPGAWVVHTGIAPLFSVGAPDRGQGLEAIAEDGDPSMLMAALNDLVGGTVPFAPGAWVVHGDGMPIFTDGMADRGDGLEALAEDGAPGALAASLVSLDATVASGVFDTPVGASAPAPIASGQQYRLSFMAEPGDYLSFATMFIESNDLFVAPADAGIALFDGSGNAVSGDVTAQVALWDAGTEVNEEPGVGVNQAPRQSGPDTGVDENGAVRVVDDAFSYPGVPSLVRVTLTVQ